MLDKFAFMPQTCGTSTQSVMQTRCCDALPECGVRSRSTHNASPLLKHNLAILFHNPPLLRIMFELLIAVWFIGGAGALEIWGEMQVVRNGGT